MALKIRSLFDNNIFAGGAGPIEEEQNQELDPNSLLLDQPSEDEALAADLVDQGAVEEQAPVAAPSIEPTVEKAASMLAEAQPSISLDDAEVKKAQQAANDQRNRVLLLQAVNTFNAGLGAGSGAKIDPKSDVLNALYRDADQPVKDIKQSRAATDARLNLEALIGENDPDSPVSQITRQSALRIMPELANMPGFEKASAKALNKVLGILGPSIASAEGRKEAAKLRAQQQEESATLRKQEKLDKRAAQLKDRDVKIHVDAVKQVTKAKGQLGSVLTTQSRKLDSAENGLRLIEQVEQGLVKPNSQVMHELAMSLASTFSGTGNPTVSGIKGFEPNNIKTNYGKAMEFLTSRPEVVLDKTYLKQFKKQLQTERDFWFKKMDKNVNGLLQGLKPIYDRKGDDGTEVNAELRDAMLSAIRGYGYANPYGKDINNAQADLEQAQKDNESALLEKVDMRDPETGIKYKIPRNLVEKAKSERKLEVIE